MSLLSILIMHADSLHVISLHSPSRQMVPCRGRSPQNCPLRSAVLSGTCCLQGSSTWLFTTSSVCLSVGLSVSTFQLCVCVLGNIRSRLRKDSTLSHTGGSFPHEIDGKESRESNSIITPSLSRTLLSLSVVKYWTKTVNEVPGPFREG